ncbi:MAG: hypothetical protein U0R52_03145 [Solirubrobacterales bacterium]
MSNMTENQRAGLERAAYDSSRERIRHGSERGATIYSVVAAVVGLALCAVALSTIEGWWQWLVLGVIVITTIGVMIAVSPRRPAE